MPLRSKAQQRWMFATHPAMAKRWAAETPNMSKLPARVRKAEGGALRLVDLLRSMPRKDRFDALTENPLQWVKKDDPDNIGLFAQMRSKASPIGYYGGMRDPKLGAAAGLQPDRRRWMLFDTRTPDKSGHALTLGSAATLHGGKDYIPQGLIDIELEKELRGQGYGKEAMASLLTNSKDENARFPLYDVQKKAKPIWESMGAQMKDPSRPFVQTGGMKAGPRNNDYYLTPGDFLESLGKADGGIVHKDYTLLDRLKANLSQPMATMFPKRDLHGEPRRDLHDETADYGRKLKSDQQSDELLMNAMPYSGMTDSLNSPRRRARGGALRMAEGGNTWAALYKRLAGKEGMGGKSGAMGAVNDLERKMPDAPKYYAMHDLANYMGDPYRKLAMMPPKNFERAAWPILSDRARKVTPWNVTAPDALSAWDKTKILGLQDLVKGGNPDLYQQAYGEGRMLPGIATPFNEVPRLNFTVGPWVGALRAGPKGLDALPQAIGHEGRHRSRALDALGVKQGLVGLRTSDEDVMNEMGKASRFYPETSSDNNWKTRNWDDVFSSRPFAEGGLSARRSPSAYEDRFIPAIQPFPLAQGGALSKYVSGERVKYDRPADSIPMERATGVVRAATGGSLSARRMPSAYEDRYIPALQPRPLAEGGALDDGDASLLGAGALAALNPRTRRLAALMANKAHTSFMRPRTPVGMYAESVSSNLPQELRTPHLQDLRYAHAAPRSAFSKYKDTLQGAWNDPAEGMQYNNLYAHEFPPTKGRVDEYLGALTPAAKLSSRLEQWGVPVQREMPRLFDQAEGSNALMMKGIDSGALKQLAEATKDQNVAIGHRPGNKAVAFSLADQPMPIDMLRELLSKHVPNENMRYAVSEPGRDRTLTGMEDWMGLGAHDRLLPERTRRTPAFVRSERKLLGQSDE